MKDSDPLSARKIVSPAAVEEKEVSPREESNIVAPPLLGQLDAAEKLSPGKPCETKELREHPEAHTVTALQTSATNKTSDLDARVITKPLEEKSQHSPSELETEDQASSPCAIPEQNTSKHRSSTPQRIDRLRRAAELNLDHSFVSSAATLQPELDERHNRIRDSKSRIQVSLKSPAFLLQQRLDVPSCTKRHDQITRKFIPPRSEAGGCILPGPSSSPDAFLSQTVRARTAGEGRAAWFCRVDKIVILDGVEEAENGSRRFLARTSKGLSIARRRGEVETIVIPMDCAHCQDMLHRREWRYDVRVCKRSICWSCTERCRWEVEVEMEVEGRAMGTVAHLPAQKMSINRGRADSVLQDVEVQK